MNVKIYTVKDKMCEKNIINMCEESDKRTRKLLIKNNHKKLTKEFSLFLKELNIVCVMVYSYFQRPLSLQYAMIQEFYACDSHLCQ